MIYGLWNNPRYVETAGLIIGSLIVLSILVFFLKQRRGAPFTSAWASLKSWLFVAPMLFAAFALPKPWPLVFVTWMGVLTAKAFFQMVGMYHRSWFVWVTYIFIFGLGYSIYTEQTLLYNLSPMIFLFVVALIPILRNSATHMIQYMALSLLAFIFWGWSYMHMGRMLTFDGGALMVLYLYLLTEVTENASWAVSKLFGKYKPFSRISAKTTIEGMIVALLVTMLVAWGLRHLLPDRSERFWIAAGLVASIFGRMGDLIINVIRRDLGIKDTGIFIIGRDGVLTRVDKLIVVGPMYFYLYIYLQQITLP
jgi:phosphatidate cytidylyltransferase